jgi:hypothetical protein
MNSRNLVDILITALGGILEWESKIYT